MSPRVVVRFTIALLASLVPPAAPAADVTVTPPAGGGFAVQDGSSNVRLRVQDNGVVTVPALPGATTQAKAVCTHATTGQLGPCASSGTSGQVAVAPFTTVGFTILGDAFAPLDSMSATVDVPSPSSYVVVQATSKFNNISGGSPNVVFSLFLDGDNSLAIFRQVAVGAVVETATIYYVFTGLTAGSHTIDARAFRLGTETVFGGGSLGSFLVFVLNP